MDNNMDKFETNLKRRKKKLVISTSICIFVVLIVAFLLYINFFDSNNVNTNEKNSYDKES